MQSSGRQAPMAEINVVPLVDVMLVLLIIFIITAPLLTHSVKIDLPKAESTANITRPQHVELASLRVTDVSGSEMMVQGADAVTLKVLLASLGIRDVSNPSVPAHPSAAPPPIQPTEISGG